MDIDTKLTNLKKVMDEETSFTSIMDSASASAERFGKTLSEVLDAYSEFARQGYKEQDLINLGDAGLITSNVGELSSAKAAEYLTSAMVQFKLETKESMSVIDAWNNVSNRNATTVEKMAQGMAKAGSTAHAFGLDMNELNAIVGTVTAATKQSGTEVGNFIKSSLPRLLSQPGQDALSQAGVSFIDKKTGDMRNVLDIYKDVSVELQNMSTIEKNMVLEGLAGKFHISRMSAFLSNFSMYEKMLKESEQSQGSASRENEKYMQSLQARINKMKQSFEELALAMGESFITEGFIQGMQGLKSVGDGLSGITKTFGGLPLLLGTATLAVGLMSKSFRGLLGTTSLLNASFLRVGVAATGMGLAIRTALASTGIGAIAVVAGMGISHLLSKMGEARERVEEFESKNRELASSYNANKTEVSNLSAEYERLSNVISGTDYSLDDLAKFNDVRNQLAQLMPELVQGEDQYGNKLIGSSNTIKSQIELIEKQVKMQEKLDALKSKEEAMKNKGSLEKSLKDKEDELHRILNISTTNVLGSNGDIKEVIKIYDSLNEKIANGEKLTMADSFNHEKAKEVIDNLKMTEAELGSLRGSYQKSIMDMIDANVTLDENTGKTTKGLINDFSLFVATSKMGSSDITSVFDNTLKSLNNKEFTGVLESYGEAIEDYQEKVNGGYSAEKLEDYEEKVKSSFTEVKNALIGLLPKGTSSKVIDEIAKSLSQSGNAALMASIDFEKLSKSTGLSTEELKASVALASDTSEGLDDVGDSAEGASGGIDKLTTATERLMGVSDGQIDSIYEMIGTYQLLSQMESLSADQKTQLAEASSYLAGIYPDLVNGSELNIEMMKSEIEATDVLRQAIDKMAQGEVSAQDAMTISAAIGAKNRLNLLRKEIQAYNEFFSQANDSANTLGAEKLAMRKLPTIQIDIDSLMSDMDSYTSTLSNSLDVNGRYTESLEKNNKEYETASYVSDKFKQALEKINLELEKQRAIQAKFPEHSKDYQSSLQKEIKLLKQKEKLLSEQAKSLAAQIKSGKIIETGLIKSKSYSSSSSSGGGGSYSGKFASEINKASSRYGVDANLIAAMIQAESSFNPNARSGAGAQGLMQLMPGTARELGVNNAYDPLQNIMGGTKYIAQQIAKFGGDIKKALWAYNAGAGNVSNILNSGSNSWKGVRAYADKILAAFNKTNKAVSSSSNSVADYYLNNFRQTSQHGENRGSSTHKGLDLANGKQGDPVKALRGGKVITATYSKSAGNWVVVQQDDGTVAKYMHMQSGLNVKAGQKISAGQQIGNVGNTGDSTGAHLHLQIEQNGKTIDPNKYLKGMQSSGSSEAEGLQSIDEAKLEKIQLEQDALAIKDQIQQLYMAIVQSELSKYENKNASTDNKIKSKEIDADNMYDKASRGYRANLSSQIKYHKEKEKSAKSEISYIEKQIKSNKDLNSVQKDELKGVLSDKKVALKEIQQTYNQINKERQQNYLTEGLETVQRIVEASEIALDKINDKIHMSDKENEKTQLSLNKTRLNQLLAMRKEALYFIRKHEALKAVLKGNAEALKDNAEEIKKWKSQLGDINVDIFDQQEEIKQIYDNIADSYVDAMKNAYETERDIKEKQIEKLRKATEEAHEEKMKQFDEEEKKLDELYSKKMREIDDQESSDDYDKELGSKQKELQDIQNEINKLAMDDSAWAKKQTTDLLEQKADKEEEINEIIHARNLELRKQALSDEKDALQKNIDDQKKIEQDSYDSKIEAFEEQLETIKVYYDNLLNNERYWSQVREDILNGDVAKYKTKLDEISKYIQANNKDIGTSIANNITDSLAEAKEGLSAITTGYDDLLDSINKTKKAQDANDKKKKADAAKKIADEKKKKEDEAKKKAAAEKKKKEAEEERKKKEAEAKKKKESEGKKKKEDSGSSSSKKPKASSAVNMRSSAGYGNNVMLVIPKGASVDYLGMSKGWAKVKYKGKTGYMGKQFLNFHEGGIVGKTPATSNRMTEIANKLFNAKPNEQIIKSLKGELQIPPKNIVNGFTNISNLVKSLSSDGGVASVNSGNTITMHITVDGSNGSKNAANEIFKQLDKGFKERGFK